jgi:hydrogenase maturation protease
LRDEDQPKVVVIGVGNTSLSDDGVASHVVHKVARRAPPWVEVVDAGLAGPGLLGLLEGRTKAVIVDAVDARAAPGTVWRFHPHEATAVDPRVSLHEGNVLSYVKLADALNIGPKDVVVVGIQPESLRAGEHLSTAVRRAVSKATTLVLRELASPATRP